MKLTDKFYRDFEIIDIREIPDCNSTGIHLRHRTNGLEIYHLLNDDKENLCSFSFRTPSENSTGVAHIIEHSSLCGSEKYPLKDPFIHLENQSLNTYLNALTGCDHTMYPVSSIIEEDYFNLVSVYADSVFFPNLKKEAFLQEAYRLEVNEKDEYSIQGVVYNEMKGVASQFFTAEDNVLSKAFFDGTIYAQSSGGDPKSIPDLTYEEYKKFYSEKYTLDNCLIFLYGNIPTEKQIDFFYDNFITKAENRIKHNTENGNLKNSLYKKPFDLIREQKIKPFDTLKEFYGTGPKSSETTDPSICVAWYLGETSSIDDFIETTIVDSILFGHDGSPLRNALLNSDLGIDIDELSGMDSGTKFRTVCYGLKGVKLKNKKKVYNLIISEIKKVIKNGVNKDDLDSALLSAEFAMKEIRRTSGPYSLVYMRKVVKAWIHGQKPETHLLLKDAFERFYEHLKSDSRYIEKLMQRYFIDNKHSAIIVVTPSEQFTKDELAKEQLQIERLKKLYTKEELLKQNSALKEYQEKDESNLTDCLPVIDIKKVKYEIQFPKAQLEWFEYAPDKKIPFAYCIQPTNGINYIDIRFPFDTLSPEDYQYVGPLMGIITEIGWGKKSYEECQTIINKYSGSFSAGTETGSMPESPESIPLKENAGIYNIAGRDWLYFKLKTLNHMTEDSLNFVADCLLDPDFKDYKRIKTLFAQTIEDAQDSFSSAGYKFLIDRCESKKNKSKATDELISGFSAYIFLKKHKNIRKLSKRISEIYKKIIQSGAFIYITCDKNSIEDAKKQIKTFASRLNLVSPKDPSPETNLESLIPYTEIYPYKNDKVEFYTKDIQVGFSGCSIDIADSPYGTREAVAKCVYSSWLSNSILWEQIRTVCGAYGAYSGVDSIEKTFSIMTYRDPDPLKSVEVIEQCLKEASEKEFSEDEISKTEIGAFSYDLTPKTPKTLGGIAENRLLYCISEENVKFRINTTLEITARDVHNAAVSVYNSFKSSSKSAVLCPNSIKKTGKKQSFHL
ncbi:MAG: insulinase family protein [Treponema sp.]|nr:insulinase family protein [Candidatus Treponema merdequi]